MEILTIAFVTAMVFIAEYFGVKDIIFPEIAALAFGAWIMEDRPWPGPAWTLWFSPTLGAITGVLILHFMPTSIIWMILVALIFVFIELKIFKSSMSPTISAAVLPIIINAKGITYPIAVFIMTGAVALLACKKENTCQTLKTGYQEKLFKESPLHETWLHEIFHYGKLVIFVFFIALIADKAAWLYILSPPLLVVFVELTHPGSLLREKSMKKLLFLLTACALEGMGWVILIMHHFSGPLWLAAGLSVATAIVLARHLRMASPPAFALALLPLILPQKTLYVYPLSVFVGGVLFIAVSQYFFRSTKPAAKLD